MRGKRFALSLLSSAFLSACSFGTPLREDIQEFISSFSLDAAVKAYKEAGYHKIQTASSLSEERVTKETFSFNVKDANHPEYRFETVVEVDGVETERTFDAIVEEEGRFYLLDQDGNREEKTLGECHSYIERYFYKEVAADAVHLYGMYYGDYIRQVAKSFQNLVTIDQEKGLYRYNVKEDHKNNNGDMVHEEQSYSVNRYGMLEENRLLRKTDRLEVVTEISTYRVE